MKPKPNDTKRSNDSGQDHTPSGQQQQAASGAGGQYGEGNYEATRQYNKGLKDHVENHDIEQEARDAAPRSAAEAKEMLEAERAAAKGRTHGVESEGEGDTKEDRQ